MLYCSEDFDMSESVAGKLDAMDADSLYNNNMASTMTETVVFPCVQEGSLVEVAYWSATNFLSTIYLHLII